MKATQLKRVKEIDGKFLFAILDSYGRTIRQIWLSMDEAKKNYVLEETKKK